MNSSYNGVGIIHFDWIRLENVVYLSNIFGVALFLTLKSFMSICMNGIKFSMQDERSKNLTDVLSRHYWDSFLV